MCLNRSKFPSFSEPIGISISRRKCHLLDKNKEMFSWQRALRHFQSTLVEAGHSLELEHAQRLCRLFLTGGLTQDLKNWWSIWQAEGIFPCSFQLKTLIYRGLWREALISLRPGMLEWCPSLAEEAVATFVANKQWELALLALQRFPKALQGDHPSRPIWTVVGPDGIQLRVLDKIVPSSRKSHALYAAEMSCLGAAQCVAAGFPLRADWQRATALCVELSRRTSHNTSEILLELAMSKSAENGRWENVLACVSQRGDAATLQMLRSSFRASVDARNIDVSLRVLDTVCRKYGTRAVSCVQLNRLVSLMAALSREERSRTAVATLSKCWQKMSTDKYEVVSSWRAR